MNITFKKGNLLASSMQCHVNTTNCVGVMGKGIALQFKQKYPDMFKDYQLRCKSNRVKLGEPYLYKVNKDRFIINFPTKGHWRNGSNLNDIITGLEYLIQHYQEWGISSIAFPALGCNNGGLDWEIVRPIMIEYASKMSIPIEIYEPID